MLGRKIIQIECVDSTNNYTANLLNDGKIEFGTVILADEQTSGKGQRGASWYSNPAQNLLFSICLDTANMSVNDQFVLTQFVSVSIVNTLKKTGLNAVIKWPNDVLINHKKIAGVLIENQLKGSRLSSTIVGIGLNINQTEFGDLKATSIKVETGENTSITEFVFSLLHEMNIHWNLVVNGDFSSLKNKYLNDLWLLNQTAKFRDAEGEFKGIIRGVEENGLLKMEKGGKMVTYDLKEISFDY